MSVLKSDRGYMRSAQSLTSLAATLALVAFFAVEIGSSGLSQKSIDAASEAAAGNLIGEYRPAQTSTTTPTHSTTTVNVVEEASMAEAISIVQGMAPEEAGLILAEISVGKAAAMMEEMAPDKAAQMLSEVAPKPESTEGHRWTA